MGKAGANISIAADTKSFTSDVRRGVIDPLEDVKEALGDLERAGDKAGDAAGDDLKRGMRDGARDSERYVDDLEDKIKGLAKTTRRTAGDAGRDLGDGFKRGTTDAGEGLDELRDEAGQTARETAASFDGSADSIVDMFQEVAANAFVGFGPAGAAAGLAIAAGIGLAITTLQEAADEANETKEAVADLAAELLEAGGKLDALDLAAAVTDWALAIGDSREWFELWQDEALTNFERVQRGAQLTGISVGDMLAAMSGYDADTALTVLDDLGEQLAELQRLQQQHGGGSSSGYATEIAQLEGLIHAIEQQNDVTSDAVGLHDELNRALQDAGFDLEAWAARTTAIENLADGVTDAAGSWSEYIDAETGAADPSAWLEGMRQRAEAITSYGDNIGTLAEQVSPETLQAVLDQGLDFAPMLQSIIDGGPDMVAELDKVLGDLERSAEGAETTIETTIDVTADTSDAETETDRLVDEIEQRSPFLHPEVDAPDTGVLDEYLDTYQTPGAFEITPSTNLTPASEQLGGFLATERVAGIMTSADTSGADSTLTAFTGGGSGRAVGRARRVTITTRADTSTADQQLNALTRRTRTARILASASTYAAGLQLDRLARDRYSTLYVNVVQRGGMKQI